MVGRTLAGDATGGVGATPVRPGAGGLRAWRRHRGGPHRARHRHGRLAWRAQGCSGQRQGAEWQQVGFGSPHASSCLLPLIKFSAHGWTLKSIPIDVLWKRPGGTWYEVRTQAQAHEAPKVSKRSHALHSHWYRSDNKGAIIGGTVGGVLGALLVAAVGAGHLPSLPFLSFPCYRIIHVLDVLLICRMLDANSVIDECV